MNPVKKPKQHFTLILCFSLLLTLSAALPKLSYSQERDEEEEKKEHSITRATVYSAILPGLGQAYNKKYWKIPIVYAGFGVTTYFVIVNTSEFKEFREAYRYVANEETYPIDNEYVGKYNLQQLEDGMNLYRRNRDLSYILTAVWYGLQILDANVDAHFFDYDISDDLTLQWEPYIQAGNPGRRLTGKPGFDPGLRLTLNF